MKVSLRPVLPVLIAAVAAITIACASGGSSPTATMEPSPSPTATATAVPSPTPSALIQLLAADPSSRDNEEFARVLLSYIPDTEQSREGFWIADYALAADLLGLDRPDPTDDAAVDAYVSDLRRGSLVASGQYLAGFTDDNEIRRTRQQMRRYVGFAQGDITHSITIGNGDRALEIVFGDIDPSVTHPLVMGCEECPPAELMSHAGIDFFAWGRDYERSFTNRFAPPLFDGSGSGGRLAVGDSIAWRSPDTGSMELMLDTAAGNETSLAGSDDHRELLELMLSRQATSVFISSKTVGKNDPDDAFLKAVAPGIAIDTIGFTDEQIALLRERYTSGVFPPPFETYAVATAYDEEGFHTLIGYVYPSEEIAQSSLAAVQQRFAEARTLIDERLYSDVFGVSVSVEGRVVVVRLGLNVAVDLVINSEPIFAHE